MAYLGRTNEPEFYYNANQETIELARRLRKRTTDSEKRLWEKLRRKRIGGVKFRRQHPIGYYIADFYCHEVRLVVEIDGEIHNSLKQKLHDENRDAEMDHLGIFVMRFRNDQIAKDIANVVKSIKKEIIKRITRKA